MGVLTTGVDLDVRCIIDAKPTKSEMLFVQTIGRGLRTAPGKDKCILLDHAGNHLRLGMVTDIHHDALDDGQARNASTLPRGRADGKVSLPRLCKACKAVLPPAVMICPVCGEKAFTASEVEAKDGELVELGSSRSKAKKQPSYNDRLKFYGELKSLKKPNYKNSWVDAMYREQFGDWPPRDWSFAAEEMPPSLATLNWVRSRQIAFAKARG